jgi:outer membrane protein assembly factor BamA
MGLALALSGVAAADPNPSDVDAVTSLNPAQSVATPAKPAGLDFVVAPIPVSNPSVGTGLALAGMLLYQTDPKSPASFSALGGGYTSNGSWLAAAAQKLNFDADLYRLTAAVGAGQVNYNYFGVGAASSQYSIPLEEKVYGGMVDLRRRFFFKPLHIGLRYSYGDVKTSLGAIPGASAPALDQAQLDLKIAGLGVVASWDTRDRQFAPASGMDLEFKSNFNDPAFGSTLGFQTYSFSWNAYWSLPEPNVLAARVYACKVSDSTPFFLTCAYGSGTDLRGYEAGRYRNDDMIAAQAEYRIHLFSRFGAVVFAGTGSVAGSFGDLFSAQELPSAGVGLRYLAVPSQGVNISVDYAWGRDGSSGLYVYIGDSF